MASISLKKLNKSFGALKVVHDIDLEIADKEFIILVGPSGCGKSTTLRMIAGLEEISGGQLLIGEDLMNDVPSKDRDIAMVFQNYALYPHMTVYKNMAFGLELRKAPRDVIETKVQEAAKILDITHLLNRKPKALSGGQRQRVALGRAMVRNPEVFLLDEPLSNLDAKLRGTMRAEISKLHKRLNATFIYVTHDQVEAMTMADRIVVMKDGHIQQVDTPQRLYDHPINMFVAGFIGAPQMNMLPSAIRRQGDGFVAVFNDHALPLPKTFDQSRIAPYLDRDIVLGIRPENFHELAPADINPANTAPFEAVVELAEPMGSEVHLNLIVAGRSVVARVSPRFKARLGEQVRLTADMTNAQLFDPQTERSILY
ncbi:sn-glycerol-3-phosphate ABC transporter ATP-binding protein UgpC [Agrobacterium vitis]|uniref:ABC transporter ATP-binding protein n=1 Tax=Agrobacterium vitis TaxID=373 RepID=UPI0008734AE8|nr:ABC transporter ATP-binding protein [Agrobacterium vitis]MCE6077987.1 sn-glycerol-3-phosphate ABC transporter ATP-binding protein UgpC [Agrobacterium vitis]MUO72807.1 sn-glycerol-3-phosphate ABC transporter ATP-binding protein UgpC [Agrobacterium vitis]MUO86706.1 sn-glycerol-3-phosphate ABC transporter ATP-binding protein UgpC [Agrobacterium vitis]MVA37483.1 sn-glycerol-3-phosphate ABC transporter ATP-binding protein UgpC [Agrobacterium vitis]MVA81536.1 sn-glycerol-3-phosphate ABC transport